MQIYTMYIDLWLVKINRKSGIMKVLEKLDILLGKGAFII